MTEGAAAGPLGRHGEPRSWEGPAEAAGIEAGGHAFYPCPAQALDTGFCRGMSWGESCPWELSAAGGRDASRLMGGSGC